MLSESAIGREMWRHLKDVCASTPDKSEVVRVVLVTESNVAEAARRMFAARQPKGDGFDVVG